MNAILIAAQNTLYSEHRALADRYADLDGPFQIIFKDEPSRKWLVRHAGMALPILAINCDTLESTKQQCELLASKYDWNANSLSQFAEKNGKTLPEINCEIKALLIGKVEAR